MAGPFFRRECRFFLHAPAADAAPVSKLQKRNLLMENRFLAQGFDLVPFGTPLRGSFQVSVILTDRAPFSSDAFTNHMKSKGKTILGTELASHGAA
jgi:hypothetical protein